VNVIVGLFNMIPGFPLDGGRILRALLWKLTNSLQRATRIASNVGQGVGLLFVALGILMAFGYRVPVFGRGLTSGMWLALIGLFLRNAAALHLRGSAINEALVGVRVRDVMRTTAPTVRPATSLRDLVEGWFMRFDEPAFPVMTPDGVFVGVVSVDDVRTIPPNEWPNRTAHDVMATADRLTLTAPEEELAVALRKLASSSVRQLPVLDRGLLVGLLYEKDVARWLELRTPAVGRAARVRHA
jgi:CBS domain-containing protein